ncbi:hypothetical protein LQ50_25090, partial [Halalkalibacter okhensis]
RLVYMKKGRASFFSACETLAMAPLAARLKEKFAPLGLKHWQRLRSLLSCPAKRQSTTFSLDN